MNERQAQGALVKGANSEGWNLFKIVDGAIGKNPFDVSGVAPGGIAVALEVKTEKAPHGSVAALPWGSFTPHQIAWLKAYAEAGAYALVALHNAVTDYCIVYVLSASDFGRDKPRSDIWSVDMAQSSDKTRYTGWRLIMRIYERPKSP